MKLSDFHNCVLSQNSIEYDELFANFIRADNNGCLPLEDNWNLLICSSFYGFRHSIKSLVKYFKYLDDRDQIKPLINRNAYFKNLVDGSVEFGEVVNYDESNRTCEIKSSDQINYKGLSRKIWRFADEINFDEVKKRHTLSFYNEFSSMKELLETNKLQWNQFHFLDLVSGHRTSGATALFYAVQKNHIEIVNLLLAFGADANIGTEDGITPLFSALYLKHHSISEKLIAANANVEVRNEEQLTPLFYLAKEGGPCNLIRIILDRYTQTEQSDIINSPDAIIRCSPFMMALVHGHYDIVQTFIEYHGNANAEMDGNSALHVAIQFGYESIIKLLINVGCDVNKKNNKGEEPVYSASALGHTTVVQLLIDENVDIPKNVSYATKKQEIRDILEFAKVVRGLSEIKGKYELLPDSTKADSLLLHVDWEYIQKFLRIASLKLRRDFLTKYQFSLPSLQKHFNALWFYILQTHDVVELPSVIKKYLRQHVELRTAVDRNGCDIMKMTSKSNLSAINGCRLLMGRYRVQSIPKEVITDDCVLYHGVDEETLDTFGHPSAVSLLVYTNKEHFMMEVKKRSSTQLDPRYILRVTDNYPNSLEGWNERSPIDIVTDIKNGKPWIEDAYFLVMPSIDSSNMNYPFGSLSKEIHQFKIKFYKLLECIQRFHEQDAVLGPALQWDNMIYYEHDEEWKLLKIHSISSFGKTLSQLESLYHHGCLPPEAIFSMFSSDHAFIRSEANQIQHGQYFDLLSADPSLDVWIFGCLLYYHTTHQTLSNLHDHHSNVSMTDSKEDLFQLFQWTDEVKSTKLSIIQDETLRNLLDLILTRQVKNRIDIQSIMNHRYFETVTHSNDSITNQPPSYQTLPSRINKLSNGKEWKHPKIYDIYLSYRSECDARQARRLHRLLSKQGVQVCLDDRSKLSKLRSVPSIRQAMITGILLSKQVITIISRRAINHPHRISQNFKYLKKDSKCDELLLEYRLILEMYNIGYIDKIIPVMIGDYHIESKLYDNFSESNCLPNCSVERVDAVYHNVQQLLNSNDIMESQLNKSLDSEATGMMSHMKGIEKKGFVQSAWTVRSTLDNILTHQGVFIEGSGESTFGSAIQFIKSMVMNEPVNAKTLSRNLSNTEWFLPLSSTQRSSMSPRSTNMNNQIEPETNDEEHDEVHSRLVDLRHELLLIRSREESLAEENFQLKMQYDFLEEKVEELMLLFEESQLVDNEETLS